MLDFSNFDIEVIVGETARLDFAVTVAGIAQDITGWLIWFTAKRRVGDPDLAAVLQHSTASGGVTLTNMAGGLGTVTVAPLDTGSLSEDRIKLFADLKARDGAGNIWPLARGFLTIGTSVTDATS